MVFSAKNDQVIYLKKYLVRVVFNFKKKKEENNPFFFSEPQFVALNFYRGVPEN